MRPSIVISVLSVVSLVAAAGCAGKSASSSSNPAPPPDGPAATTDVGMPTGMATTASIGPEGGQLVSADGRLTLIVPPSAVASPTSFGIQPITNQAPGGVGDAYRITPDGQQFATPATILFTYADADLLGTSADVFDIAYQDPSAHTWLAYDAVTLDTNARHVQIQTSHLTDWAMLDGFNLRPTGQHVKLGEAVQFSIINCKTTGQPMAVPGGGTVSGVQACKEVTDVVDPNTSGDDGLLGTPHAFKNWAVNGAPGGTDGTGLVMGTDDFHATYTAPSKRPSMNPVTVSAQTTRGGMVTTVTALVYIDAAKYHVDATYSQPGGPICTFGTGDLFDHFSMDVDVDAQSVTNIQNDNTMISNTHPGVGATSVTTTSPPEVFTLTKLEDIQGGSVYTVNLQGTTKPGACTVYYGSSPLMDPGTPPSMVSVSFPLDESRFDASGSQVVSGRQSVGWGATSMWTVTITTN